ncbi:PepSY domain-containing protein [Fusobacterium varium]|uniref:PepSY domain-containing protein n=1 Tax=Fusobacterium varium TaxID=856 RepID=UPI000BBB5A91|nr:PepSY domain-containing protein [uncultured Fusobacterium sp.]BBA50761.1 hypothetical protein FV113G1_11090 [Fusobacterium varium]
MKKLNVNILKENLKQGKKGIKTLLLSTAVLMMLVGTGVFAGDSLHKKRAREAEINLIQKQAISNGIKLISPEEAKQAALSAVGIKESEVKYFKIKLDQEDDYRPALYVYEVEFVHDGLEYEFDIDAANKKILKSDVDSWFD